MSGFRLDSAVGRQLSSLRRTAPKAVFGDSQRTVFSSACKAPGPKYKASTSFGQNNSGQPAFSFSEGREFMYDERVPGNTTGPGDYNNAKSSLGKQHLSTAKSYPCYRINASRRKPSLFEDKHKQYLRNTLFTNKGTASPGPAQYTPSTKGCDSSHPNDPAFSMGEKFIKHAARPPWALPSQEAEAVQIETQIATLTNRKINKKMLKANKAQRKMLTRFDNTVSSVGVQQNSNRPSMPAFRFSRGVRRGPESWVAGPEIIQGEKTPGAGHYLAKGGAVTFAMGMQPISHHSSAPSFGFSKSSRFGDKVYSTHADHTKRHTSSKRSCRPARRRK